MKISAKVIASSLSKTGNRIDSVEVTLPRSILAQLNTHGLLTRSAMSSRAIPVGRMIEQVEKTPYIPVHWGKNQAGMQADGEVLDKSVAEEIWLSARDAAVKHAKELHDKVGLHKQEANRLLEPFMWTRAIITATSWENFFDLRRHESTQPAMVMLADAVYDARMSVDPLVLNKYTWHAPYVTQADIDKLTHDNRLDLIPILSSARCARVSYNKHDGANPSIQEDVVLFEHLAVSRPAHLSPLAHVAQQGHSATWFANYLGWVSFRRQLEFQGYGEYPAVGSTKR